MPLNELFERIDSPQIHHIRAFPVALQGVTVTGGDTDVDVTAPLTALLGTLGRAGTGVPVLVSPGKYRQGIVSDGIAELPIIENVGKEPIAVNGVEVYGRLTEAAGVYTLAFFTLDDAGTETAVALDTADLDIDLAVLYRFKFEDQPEAGEIATLNIKDDPITVAPIIVEPFTITTDNTFPALAKTPTNAGEVIVHLQGRQHHEAHGAFTLAGTTVTRVPGTAGYNALAGYKGYYEYRAF